MTMYALLQNRVGYYTCKHTYVNYIIDTSLHCMNLSIFRAPRALLVSTRLVAMQGCSMLPCCHGFTFSMLWILLLAFTFSCTFSCTVSWSPTRGWRIVRWWGGNAIWNPENISRAGGGCRFNSHDKPVRTRVVSGLERESSKLLVQKEDERPCRDLRLSYVPHM